MYVELAFGVSGTIYRFVSEKPEPAAFGVLSLMVVVSLSTLAQNLFTLDGAARLRWEQSPRLGYEHLWRKGRWLLGMSAIFCAGLSPAAAVTGMLICLAIGHHNSVLRMTESAAWGSSSGQFFPHGFLQVEACFAGGIAVARGEPLCLFVALLAYLASLFVYGWVFERS